MAESDEVIRGGALQAQAYVLRPNTLVVAVMSQNDEVI